MIETRIKRLFDYLTSDYVYRSAEEIGEALELSSKTIRNEIDILNSYLEGHGASVECKLGKGYIFNISNQFDFEDFLKKQWYKYAFFAQDFNDKKYRIERMLSLFVFSKSFIKQQELAELFYVSTSQINKDIKEVRRRFEEYNITLLSKPYYGMKIYGEEKDIRYFIKNELGEEKGLFDQDENKELYYLIENIVDIDLFDPEYHMPYANYKQLVIHIYISILRIKSNNYIKLPDVNEMEIVDRKDYEIAKRIVNKLSAVLNIEFPKQELMYIAMHLITKNRITEQEKVSAEVSELADLILEEIFIAAKYDLRDNIEFYFSLCQHLGPLLERIKFGLVMKNPLLEDIKKYPVAFNLAVISAKVVNDRYDIKLSEDEIAYIALHLSNAIESNVRQKKKILIVCASGRSSSNMMRIQLEKRFHRDISTLEVIDYSKLTDYDLDEYDFIVSSIELDITTKTPVVVVDVIFKQNDFNNIEKRFHDEELEEIYSIFRKSVFVNDENLKNRNDVFNLIANKVSDITKVSEDSIYAQLVTRETFGSTAFDYKIAIPHIMEPISDESFMVIIIPKEEVQWEDKKVSLILSLFIGKKQRNMDLFYNKLGDFMTDKNLIDESKKAIDQIDFLGIFLGGKYERSK